MDNSNRVELSVHYSETALFERGWIIDALIDKLLLIYFAC
jgi:hypothetical protein